MKAVTRKVYGSPDILSVKEVSNPTPKDNEVLVKVYCTTVNRTDCAILRGKPNLMRLFIGLIKPKYKIPGTDFAGVIESIGSKVTNFKPGDRVWGFNDQGVTSQAQFMTTGANKSILKIPKGIEFDHAVSAAEGAHYAFNIINKVKLSPDSNVLVYGATGAIGSALVQLLKYHRARVTAVGNTPNLELIKSLGADKIIDYLTQDFTKDIQKYNFIFDAVGKTSFGVCKPLLVPKGIYISSELGPNNENLYLPFLTKIKGGKRVIFPIPSDCKRTLLFMNNLLEEEKFKAVIDKEYSIEKVKDAYNYAESGQKTGNIILNLQQLKN
jgi:NADPH:quinone reductase-like Zn-dependent oxidoreductase